MKKILSAILIVTLLFALCIPVFAVNPVEAPSQWLGDWEERTSIDGKIRVLPGEDENDRVFSWVSGGLDSKFTYSDGVSKFTLNPDTSVGFLGVTNTVKIKNLKVGDYKYSFTSDGKVYTGTFSIEDTRDGFTVMFCSDPQLGRSGDNSEKAVQDDTYGWERTLLAGQKNGAELILCAGDQANDGFSLSQYNAFFSPKTMSSLPIAATAGNHDFYSPLFAEHFASSGVDAIGNDYYFTYGNAVFIVLDGNNIISPIHEKTISDAIKNCPDASWRIVMMHQGAYSSEADEFTNIICAGTLKGLFDRYDIDMVLSGHNHFYSRTYPLYDGEISSVGTVYFEQGSASGGKCSIIDVSDKQYIVNHVDLEEAAYSLLTFSDDTIKINSYKTDSGEIFDSFTVVNTEKASTLPLFGLFGKLVDWFMKILSYIPALY